MKQFIYLFLFILSIVSCQDSSYQFKWKLNPGEKLIYMTRMEIIKGQSYVSDKNNVLEMVETLGKLKGDTVDVPFEMSDVYDNMIEQSNAEQHFSFLEPQKDYISLEIIGKRKKQISQPKYPLEDFFPDESVTFTGKILSDGSIKDNGKFFLQNYLINIMFELPKNKVAIGDSWSLDIKMFDFGKKPGLNKVSFVDIITEGEDEIAVLEYRIKSSDKNQNMFLGTIDYKGTAEFNITKGKWASFKGTMVFSSMVLTEMKQTQKLELVEISETTYNNLIESYKKVIGIKSIEDKIVEVKPTVIEVEKTNKEFQKSLFEESKKCPVIYSVQILASAEPIPLNSKEFKGVPYKIEQRYDPAQPKFKYKYLIGNECSRTDALKLKKQIKNAGFPEAFIVKR